MHPRHRIDASVGDALFALAGSLAPPAVPRGNASRTGDALVCLSVRSAFDLLLTALDLPPGDEVLVSSITHPDMVRVVRLHGLQAVPIDIHPLTLAPIQELLETAVTTRTRAVLLSHLFGARIDLQGVVKVARRRGLLLIEDCAQSIRGPDDEGDPSADVALFSFGVLKTATAFGGAIARVRDGELASRMEEIQRHWPLQPNAEYARKAIQCLVAILVSGRPAIYGVAFGRNTDARVVRFARAIPAGSDEAFRTWLRRRPCPAMVSLLERRLRGFPSERLRRRTQAGDELAAQLPPGLVHPGEKVASTHWLFPVVSDRPKELIVHLRRHGFDVTQGASQIAVVPAPAERLQFDPHHARRLMGGMVFLPAYPELPEPERGRLIEALSDFTRL